jgi:glycosyltransferase involved in cell wall biosynthesis
VVILRTEVDYFATAPALLLLNVIQREGMCVNQRLRIGIDLTGIWRPSTGIFTYAKQLASELLRLNKQNSYTLFFSGEIHPEFQELKEKFHAAVIPFRGEVLSKQLLLPALCNLHKLDLIHFPALPPPVACFRPFVWTLHDATPWLYPGTMDFKGRLYFRWVGACAARASKAIITVSKEAKRNIVDSLAIPEGKVRVIYEGVDAAFRALNDSEFMNSVRSRYQLPERFILTVGTLEPRKNLSFLIDAYRRLCEVTQTELGLVIVGRSGWNMQAIQQRLSEGGGRIVLTGFVPQEDLVAFYNLAEIFVLPSLYEGFGFPPLEAMACGCPVIVSDRGSLPEIVEDAAVVIDPENIDSLVGALRSVLSIPALRTALKEKGLARVRQFSWRTAAIKTLDLYSEILGAQNSSRVAC